MEEQKPQQSMRKESIGMVAITVVASIDVTPEWVKIAAVVFVAALVITSRWSLDWKKKEVKNEG